MPVIESISPAKRGHNMVVRLSDDSILRFPPETVIALDLHPGMEITQELLDTAGRFLLTARARNAAAAIVSVTSVSKKELIDRLCRKEIPRQEAEAAAVWLEDIDILNDRVYAESLVRKAGASKLSKRAIEYRLRQKGVDKETALQAAEHLPPPDDALDDLIAKRMQNKEPSRDEIARLGAYLARRGFNWEDIRAAIGRFLPGKTDD